MPPRKSWPVEPQHDDRDDRVEETAIKKLWKEVRNEREDREFNHLSKRLKEIRPTGSWQRKHQKTFACPPRNETSGTVGSLASAKPNAEHSKKKKAATTRMKKCTLTGGEQPIPPHTGRLHLARSYKVDDMKDLEFVPSACSEAIEENVAAVEEYYKLFDPAAREKDINDGPLHHVQSINHDIVETIRRYKKFKSEQNNNSCQTDNDDDYEENRLFSALSALGGVDEERMAELYHRAMNTPPDDDNTDPMSSSGSSSPNQRDTTPENQKASAALTTVMSPPRRKIEFGSESSGSHSKPSPPTNKADVDMDEAKEPYAGPYCQPAAPSLAEDDPDYLELVDSFRKLYCKRCRLYDCMLHRSQHGLPEKASLQLSYELGMSYEGEARKTTRRPSPSSTSIGEDNNAYDGIQELSNFHKAICRRFFLIYEGDIEKMATVMRAPQRLLNEFVEANGWRKRQPKPNAMVLVPPPVRDPFPYHSLRNYNTTWYSRIIKSGLRPSYEPCVHDEPCKEEVCTCVDRQIFCTGACAWGRRSRNFFRGCDCKSNCTTTSCSCHANSRECNPDVCKCDTCTDPAGRPATKQRCRNDNLTMERARHNPDILLGRSDVPKAGWGGFARRYIPKGTFLGEYVGEMISQEEADRRGQLYDIQNHSSLFMLNADIALDADRKGNLVRYINHSATPNTTPRTMTVNGDDRIAFFTLRDIEPQTELTFNYGYNFSVNNDFVLKSAKAVPWMELTAAPLAAEDPLSQSDEPGREREFTNRAGYQGKNGAKKRPQGKKRKSCPTHRKQGALSKPASGHRAAASSAPVDVLGQVSARGAN